jgi:hypothetical protein
MSDYGGELLRRQLAGESSSKQENMDNDGWLDGKDDINLVCWTIIVLTHSVLYNRTGKESH